MLEYHKNPDIFFFRRVLQSSQTKIWNEVYLTPESMFFLFYCLIMTRTSNKLFLLDLLINPHKIHL